MDLISKSKQEAIELLNKLDIAIIEENLVYYSQQGNIDNVRLLIIAGVSANAFYYLEKEKKKHYYSPLYSAYANNHLEIAEILIKNGANINFNDSNNVIPTPINYAIEQNNPDLLRFFIKNGADVNFKGKTDTELIPIYQTIKQKKYDLLQILIENNVDLNIKGSIWGSVTPLTYSINKTDSKAVSMLIEAGADLNLAVNSSLETPLIVAIRKNNFDIFKILIEKGSDVNKSRKDGRAPLSISYQKRYDNFISALINAKAKPLTEEELQQVTSFSVKNKFEGLKDLYRNNRIVKIGFWVVTILLLLFLIGKGCNSCNTSFNSNGGSNYNDYSGEGTCCSCNGDGKAENAMGTCMVCGGSGKLKKTHSYYRANCMESTKSSSNDSESYSCPHCNGNGKRINSISGAYQDCASCGGDGKVTQVQYNRLSK